MKVVGFAGFSGSGKTTLVEQLIPELRLRSLRVSVVKHAHHSFDMDHPGKDTYRHREAGAFEVVAASDKRLMLVREFEQPAVLSVHHLLAELYQGWTGCWWKASRKATCSRSKSGAHQSPANLSGPCATRKTALSWPLPPTLLTNCPSPPCGRCSI